MRWAKGGEILFLAKARENAGLSQICGGYGGEKLRVDLADKTGELLDGMTLHLAGEPILTGLRCFAGLVPDLAAEGRRANCRTAPIAERRESSGLRRRPKRPCGFGRRGRGGRNPPRSRPSARREGDISRLMRL